jgi:hypothetical protein
LLLDELPVPLEPLDEPVPDDDPPLLELPPPPPPLEEPEHATAPAPRTMAATNTMRAVLMATMMNQ